MSSNETWRLDVRDVHKAFGDIEVLNGASYSLAAGEVLAIMGASGSGKSTLGKILCGHLRADRGTACFDGLPTGVAPTFSWMPQELGIWSCVSVRQQLSLLQRSARPRGTRVFVEGLLRTLGLTDRLQSFPEALSGGENRRLAFFRAVSVRSHVLVLDEPFASVDEETEVCMQQVLRQYIADTRCGVLLITHDFDHALLLADRAAVLHRGLLVQLAPPAELRHDPVHAAVARIVGGMNVWGIRGRDDSCVLTAGGKCPIPERYRATTGHRVAYAVPDDSIAIGEGDVTLRGRAVAVVPSHRGVTVVMLSRETDQEVRVGISSREAVSGCAVGGDLCVSWDRNAAVVLNDD